MAAIGTEMQNIRKEKAALQANLFDMITSLQYDKEDEEWIQGALEVFKRGE